MIESHEAGSSIKFHEVLRALDERAAARVREAGCPRCGGRLYAAHYERKVRGLSDEAAEAGGYERRLSLCCGREGCRSRATPPSTRFSGRRIYATIAVLALSLSGAERTEASDVGGVAERRGAPARSTRRRWLSWWRVDLLQAPWFALLCAQLAEPLDGSNSPGSLLLRFTGSLCARLERLIVWLCPLTTSSLSAERSRISMAG